jgi:branched-chain amino acid transport system substrate-binding protein
MSSQAKGALRPTAALLIAMAIALAAMPVSHAAWAAEDLAVGALLPLTGPASPTGAEQVRGVQFAIARANSKGGIRGRQIKAVIEDSQGKPDQGMLGFNRLVELHKVPASLTAFTSITLAILPVAARNKVVLVNGGAQSSRLENASPYLFNSLPMPAAEIGALTKFTIEKLGKKTAAIIYENAAAGIDGRDDFKKAFLAAGGKIVAEEPVEFGQTNFRPMLLKVASTHPDFVFIHITSGHKPFADQVAQVENFPLGLSTTFGTFFFGQASTLGWYHSIIRSEIAPDIEAEYAKMFPGVREDAKVLMGFWEREYFNSTNIILKAMDRVLGEGGTVTGEAIRKAILDIKTFEGTARITFNTNTATRQIDIMRLDQGVRTRMD